MRKDTPILFSGPMIRAILAGTKTQTRRLVKHHSSMGSQFDWRDPSIVHVNQLPQIPFGFSRFCPYGKKGDTLWVRETHCYHLCDGKENEEVHYQADGNSCPVDDTNLLNRWRPSIFMFRRHCRINLEITDVRIERLTDITEEDAKAEGTTPVFVEDGPGVMVPHPRGSHTEAYRILWNKLNKDARWEDENKWVWVVSFVRI